MALNNLERRIIDLSYKHRLSHISSCLNTVNVLDEISMGYECPIVLGNGHAGLALYVHLENQGKCDAEEMLKLHGIHPVRDVEHGVVCSSGSLGQAETIAVGMAMADQMKLVALVTSDGACMEGSVSEAMRFAWSQGLTNLVIQIIANGFGAYSAIPKDRLPRNATIVHPDTSRFPEWLQGLNGHYVVMDQAKYEEITS